MFKEINQLILKKNHGISLYNNKKIKKRAKNKNLKDIRLYRL